MKLFYISLGSFCHPKILLRETNRPILQSLPFDFHSSPCTYSIYNILKKLYNNKKYIPEFKEILYKHHFNIEHKNELAVKDIDDIYFLHFFDENDLIKNPEKYPASIEYINTDKIKYIQTKFEERFKHLYNLLNDPENMLVFLRIENYENPSWSSDISNLCDALSLFKNKNKFLIYSQINIEQSLDFEKTKSLNYQNKIPIMYIKKNFTENISFSQKDEFLNILNTFENIIDNCLTLFIENELCKFYYNQIERKLFMLNNLNYWLSIIKLEDNLLICHDINNNKKLIFNYQNNIFYFKESKYL